MSRVPGRTPAFLLVVPAAMISFSAVATDGYFSHGYGSESKARAGSGTAFSTEALSVATNPANVQRAGNRLDVGLAYFRPDRGFVVEGNPSGAAGSFPLEPGDTNSNTAGFYIPHFGYTRKIDERASWGLAVYGNGGMNTDYGPHDNPVRNQGGMCPSGTFCAGQTGVDLTQLFVVPSYALKVHPHVVVGVAPIIAYQRFRARGLGAFGAQGFSSDANNLTDNGYDDAFGYGLRVGGFWQAAESIALGASYQSRISMDEFSKYRGLFAEQGNLDIPSTANIGAAFALHELTTLTVDVFHTMYSEVNSIGNPLIPNIQTAQLGNNEGAGFGWDDVTVVKLGIEHRLSDQITLRGGYSNGESPIDRSDVTLNVLAPGIVTDHYTLGGSFHMEGNSSINLAMMYSEGDDVVGPNAFETDPNTGQSAQTISLYMDQVEFELSYSKRFR